MKGQLFFLSITFLIIMSRSLGYAQDVIIDKKGEMLKTKVMEVNITEIKYKKWDNIDGPTYSISKSDVLSIHYQNGTKEVFSNTESEKPKKSNEVFVPGDKKNMNAEQRYNYEMTLAKRRLPGGIVFTTLGPICIGTGAIFIKQGIDNSEKNSNGDREYTSTGTGYMAAGVISVFIGAASTIIGPILLSTSGKHRRLANEAKQSMSFSPIMLPSRNTYTAGLGIRIKF